jgi:hypothetical protein
MKKSGFCLGIALIVTAHAAAAKEATPNEANKSLVDPVKRERRFSAPEVKQTDAWQPYLRWHQDASSQNLNDRSYSLLGVVLNKQL